MEEVQHGIYTGCGGRGRRGQGLFGNARAKGFGNFLAATFPRSPAISSAFYNKRPILLFMARFTNPFLHSAFFGMIIVIAHYR